MPDYEHNRKDKLSSDIWGFMVLIHSALQGVIPLIRRYVMVTA